jgi:hypothetical protein
VAVRLDRTGIILKTNSKGDRKLRIILMIDLIKSAIPNGKRSIEKGITMLNIQGKEMGAVNTIDRLTL